MYKRQVGSSLSTSLVCLGLTACGSAKVGSVSDSPVLSAPAQTPPTTLTGNWLLTGSRVPAAYPAVSTSLYIEGNVVTGDAAFFAQCTSAGVPSTVSSSGIPITGIIAHDGTFPPRRPCGPAPILLSLHRVLAEFHAASLKLPRSPPLPSRPSQAPTSAHL